MPKRRVPSELFLVNILVAVDKIMRHSKFLAYADFLKDEKIFGFLTRELQEIGESVNKLLKAGSFSLSENRKWKKVVDFRNVVVHKYFGVHPEIVFEIITKNVLVLKDDILEFIQGLENKVIFFQALSDTKKVYLNLGRYETVAYLDKIKEMLS